MGAIALDNSVLSPLIKSGAGTKFKLSEDDKRNAPLARNLVNVIRAENKGKKKELETKICIPTPAFTECLAAWEVNEQPQALADLSTVGEILVYDEHAALIAAKIYAEMKAKGSISEMAKAGGRQCVKVDIMIMACCKAHGVGVLYSTDPDFEKMAELASCKGVVVSPLPKIVGTKAIQFGESKGGESQNEKA